jgi:hypothetical protein
MRRMCRGVLLLLLPIRVLANACIPTRVADSAGSRQFLYQLVGFDNLLRRSDISESEQSGSK